MRPACSGTRHTCGGACPASWGACPACRGTCPACSGACPVCSSARPACCGPCQQLPAPPSRRARLPALPVPSGSARPGWTLACGPFRAGAAGAGPCGTDTGDEDTAASGMTVTTGAAIADIDGAGVPYVPAVLCGCGAAVRVQPGLAVTCGTPAVVPGRPADVPGLLRLPGVLGPVRLGPVMMPGLVNGDELALAAGVIRAQACAAACSAATPTYGAGTRACGSSSERVAPAAFHAYASRTPTATGAIAETSPAPPFLLSRLRTFSPSAW